MRVIWTEGAVDDLEEIVQYIRKDSPDAARRVASTIFELAMRLSSSSRRGRMREDGSLELVVPSMPYIILYGLSERAVFIKAIRHTSRDWSR